MGPVWTIPVAAARITRGNTLVTAGLPLLDLEVMNWAGSLDSLVTHVPLFTDLAKCLVQRVVSLRTDALGPFRVVDKRFRVTIHWG